jgi:hypothetical protein
VTLAIPTGIFSHVRFLLLSLCYAYGVSHQDILPKPEGFTKQVCDVLGRLASLNSITQDFGQCAIRSDGIV